MATGTPSAHRRHLGGGGGGGAAGATSPLSQAPAVTEASRVAASAAAAAASVFHAVTDAGLLLHHHHHHRGSGETTLVDLSSDESSAEQLTDVPLASAASASGLASTAMSGLEGSAEHMGGALGSPDGLSVLHRNSHSHPYNSHTYTNNSHYHHHLPQAGQHGHRGSHSSSISSSSLASVFHLPLVPQLRRELLMAGVLLLASFIFVVLLIFFVNAGDSRRHSCGRLVPLAYYRFCNHVDVYLRPLVFGLSTAGYITGCLVIVLGRIAVRWRNSSSNSSSSSSGGGGGDGKSLDGPHDRWCRWLAKLYFRLLPRMLLQQPARLRQLSLALLALYLGLIWAGQAAVPTDYPHCHSITNLQAANADWAKNGRVPLRLPGNAYYDHVSLSPPYHLDVMIAAVKPTCVNQQTVRALLQNFGPRRIYIVTPERFCSTFSTFAPSGVIHCIPEDTLAPGLNLKALQQYLSHRKLDPERAGWYLQQFCKLLFWLQVPDLTSHFLIWDSDMIMLPNFRLYNELGQLRQHTGGIFVSSYATVYHSITGEKMLFGPRWESFVVHHVGVYLPFLKEMLQKLGFEEHRASEPNYVVRWAGSLLDRVGYQEMHQGLTEYGAYVSWILTHHRHTVELLNQRGWMRDGKMSRASEGICCPTLDDVRRDTRGNPELEYLGYELGHAVNKCNFNDDVYRDGYFPPGWDGA